jgi:hypothetical protein
LLAGPLTDRRAICVPVAGDDTEARRLHTHVAVLGRRPVQRSE